MPPNIGVVELIELFDGMRPDDSGRQGNDAIAFHSDNLSLNSRLVVRRRQSSFLGSRARLVSCLHIDHSSVNHSRGACFVAAISFAAATKEKW